MADGVAALSRAAPWRRHELVAVDPRAWTAALAEGEDGAHPLLSAWAEQGWPVIVRRRGRADPPGRVPVGTPLPLCEGKRRIAVALPPQAVTARFSLPGLEKVRGAAPPLWGAVIAALLELGVRFGVEPAAFGSLFWEFCTGQSYISSASDLDLLWVVGPGTDVPALLEGIAELERGAPMRLDGEIAFPDGQAAHWRELRNALHDEEASEVLVKTVEEAQLRPVRNLLSPAVFG